MESSASRLFFVLLIQLNVIVFSFQGSATAQDTLQIKGLYLGVGAGQDVGGLPGARLTYWITPHIAGFIGGGWALVEAAYSAGVELRVPSKSRTNFFVTGFYGYTSAIKIKKMDWLNGLYYGPTVGMGLMLRQRYIVNYWRFSVNLPFRSQESLDHIEALQRRPELNFPRTILPFSLGVGYHFGL